MTINIVVLDDAVRVTAGERSVTLHDPNPEVLAAKLHAQITEESPDTDIITIRVPQERLLTTTEAADRLGISRDAIYTLIHSGDLVTVRVGTGKRQMHRIEPHALADFIIRNRAIA